MTSDSREGRTGVNVLTFLSEGTFDIWFWHKKYVFTEKKQKVNGGQKSKVTYGVIWTGSICRLQWTNFQPEWTFSLSYHQNTGFWPLIDLSWPWITWRLFFKMFPRFIYILPQNMNHVRLSYIELSHFLFLGFFAPHCPTRIVRAPKTIGHIYSLWAISTPLWHLYYVRFLSYRSDKRRNTHTYTHTYTPTPTGPHRFLMLTHRNQKPVKTGNYR